MVVGFSGGFPSISWWFGDYCGMVLMVACLSLVCQGFRCGSGVLGASGFFPVLIGW